VISDYKLVLQRLQVQTSQALNWQLDLLQLHTKEHLVAQTIGQIAGRNFLHKMKTILMIQSTMGLQHKFQIPDLLLSVLVEAWH
jgi:hypothetical protein